MTDLLEYFELTTSFVFILERPEPCITLYKYCKSLPGKVPEAQAQTIMQHVVQAVHHCTDHSVFHRDITLHNGLLNPGTSEAKLIDFGYGYIRKETPYTEFEGTFPSKMSRFNRYSVVDHFCDLADHTVSLSFIQSQSPSHCIGSLQTRTWRNVSPSGIWAYPSLHC